MVWESGDLKRAARLECTTLDKYGRIGEAGRVTDRTVEEWQARRCMSRFCKERFGVAGGDRCFVVRPVPARY